MAQAQTPTSTPTPRAPAFVRLGNLLVAPLLRAGVKMVGPNRIPTYLLTVRGRKSGQSRTTPIVVIQQDRQRYLLAPFGAVDWVRNLRAAGEATLTRGRRTERVRATELPTSEAARVLQGVLAAGNVPSFLMKYVTVTAESSHEELEAAAEHHPVFLLQATA
jgi:deazaflavin-dependent oxidoreductase (nitroreductase family)